MSQIIKRLLAVSTMCVSISIGLTQQAAAEEVTSIDSMQSIQDMKELSSYVRTGETADLPAPGSVTQEKITYNSVTIQWDSVQNAFGYQISYAKKEDGEYTVAGTTTADVLSYPVSYTHLTLPTKLEV